MRLVFLKDAKDAFHTLEQDAGLIIILKSVRKALAHIEIDPRYPALNTHPYPGFSGKNGEKVFGSYAQNNTPSAWRILWHYGPEKDIITIIAIIKHL